MKKVIASLLGAAVVLAGGLFALSSRAIAGPVPDPPDGDWSTWTAVLESRRCYEQYLARRLRASGRDWSYEQFRRRVSISMIPEQKSISVRAHFSSQLEAKELALLARESLLELLKELEKVPPFFGPPKEPIQPPQTTTGSSAPSRV